MRPHDAARAAALALLALSAAASGAACADGERARPAPTAPPPAAPARPVGVRWLGHAAFEIVSPGGTRLLVDPWLTDNPRTPAPFRDLARFARERPDAILVTHAHDDHAGDVPALARASRAPVVSTREHLNAMQIDEAQQLGVNVGGALQIGDVSVHPVPAMHASAPNGRPFGYVLRFAGGRSLYHTGDTWVFGDMALIEELFHPDVVLLAAGGGPMGPDAKTALFAVRKYFRPSVIVPMHFGTYEPLAGEAEVRAAFASDRRARFLTPGELTPL